MNHEQTRTDANGDPAAMREAINTMVNCIEWLCEGDNTGCIRKQFAPLLSYARAALAAPPRNCDVGTAEEQAERFDKHCQSFLNREGIKACVGCPCCGVVMYGKCELAWEQMPYVEGGEAWNGLKKVLWRDTRYEGVQWYYAEERLYVLRVRAGQPNEHYLLIKADSPEDAIRRAIYNMQTADEINGTKGERRFPAA